MRIRGKLLFSKRNEDAKRKKETFSKGEKIVLVALCIFIAALFILTVYAVAFTVSRLKFLI